MKRLLSFVLLLTITQVNAAVYYVDPSSTASTENGSINAPYKSLSALQGIMMSLAPGDFVYFKKGQTFNGSFNMRRSGTAVAPITFSTYGTSSQMPVFTGAGEYMIQFSYVQYVVFDGIKIMDPTMNPDDHNIVANLKRAFNIDQSSFITVRNCEMTLVGTGFNIMGSNNRIENNRIYDLRMIRNTVTTINNNDDYGAMAMVITGANNEIYGNYMKDCWAYSFDYQTDGGAVEIFGPSTNGNKVMYNTAINCNGFMEFGSSSGGISQDNLVAYNKIINCGNLTYINNGGDFMLTVSNFQVFNNVFVESYVHTLMGSRMIGMRSATTSTGIVILKNNIFWLMNGIDVAQSSRFTDDQLIHENNIYRLGTGSVLNYAINPSELNTTSSNIFYSTSGADPETWNLKPGSNSPAVGFGLGLGLTRDIEGVAVPATRPNAGIHQAIFTPVNPLVVSTTRGTIACNGGTTTVTVSATGGTSPYTGTGTFTVSAGTYTYTVTDATGATATSTVTVTQPTALTATVSTGAVTVTGGTTTITVSAGGGTGSLMYRLNGGSFQTSNVFNNVGIGTHIITVRDSLQCSITRNVSIVLTAALAVSATPGSIACNGGTTSVTVSASGGTAPYTGTGTFSVPAGTHTYTVRDANGVTATRSVTVSQPAAISATVSSGTILIIGSTTSITVSASGGTGTLNYRLNSGSFQAGNVFTGVAAGTHTITVRDANNCTATRTITITQPQNLVATATAGSIACNGGTTTVTVTATGGLGSYTGTGTFTVRAGTYTYTVRDSVGNTASTNITLTEPTAVNGSVTSSAVSSLTATTSVTVTGSGGTPGYFYSLNFGPYFSSGVFNNLTAGSYNVRVRDSRACIKSVPFTIEVIPTTPLNISVTYSPISCNGSTTAVTVSATGGVAPYTGTGTFNVGAGTYDYVVTDAINSRDTERVVITQPSAIALSLSAGTITVNGGTTSITASASGGAGGYSYRLGTGSFQTSNVFTNISAGTYQVTARDSRGCLSVARSITITQPPLPFSMIVASKKDISCRWVMDGQIILQGQNGYPPYQYKRGNNAWQSSNVFSNIGNGTYTMFGRDSTGRTVSIDVVIGVPNISCSSGRPGNASEQPAVATVENLVTVYPNPTNGYFRIRLPQIADGKPARLTVTDVKGKIMYQQTANDRQEVWLGEDFPSGVYILQLVIGNKVSTHKLVKTK